MKKIVIITAALILGLFINTNAQQGQRGNPPSKEERVKRTMTELSKEVGLTDEEKTSLEEIFNDFYTKMEDLRKEGTRPDRTKIAPLVEDRDKKVKAVLPEEKYKAYTTFMENRRRRPQGGPQGNQQ